jgi:hypothetical protein
MVVEDLRWTEFYWSNASPQVAAIYKYFPPQGTPDFQVNLNMALLKKGPKWRYLIFAQPIRFAFNAAKTRRLDSCIPDELKQSNWSGAQDW